MENFTFKLSKFVKETKYENLPEEVINETKKRILDVVGIGLSGFDSVPGREITKYIKNNNYNGKSTLWGSGIKTSAEYAALANATMTFHLELDDVHRTSHTHPGVSTIPVALALVEELNLTGKELIEAIVVGYEIGIRVGLALSPSIYVDRPFLAPGTLSTFSSAAAAAKLYDYNLDEIVGILGSAAYITPISPFETFKRGFSTKDIIMGWGGLTGIISAKIREYNFEGADTGIEGEFGYAETAAEHYDIDKGLSNISDEYLILKTGVKPYACCRQHHAAIDATLAIRNKYDIDVNNIKKITDQTFKVSSRGNNPKPRTISEAKYSNPYIIAVALLEGDAWRGQFTEAKIKDPDILDLASKVEVINDDQLDKLYDEKWPSIITITMKNGEEYSERIDLPKGEPEHPVSDEELKNKYLSLSTDTISNKRAEKIWNMTMKIDELENVYEFTSLLFERG